VFSDYLFRECQYQVDVLSHWSHAAFRGGAGDRKSASSS
jgi:hypothetical protein